MNDRAQKRMAVLGGGRLAQAVSTILSHAGVDIRLWEKLEDARPALRKALPKVTVVDSIEEAVRDVDTVFFAVPAAAFLEVADAYGPFAKGDHVVFHAARGVGEGFILPHEAIRARTAVKKVGALGGPLYFADLKERRPLFVVVAARYGEVISRVKSLCAGTQIRLHPCADLVGVEVAGAISNVAAIAGGMSDALGFGETARGVILTRGLSEATRLGLKLGADPSTFAGLAGVGDLIPRKTSGIERHTEVGRRLAAGENVADILPAIDGSVDGVLTIREGSQRARDLGLDLPLLFAMEAVVEGTRDPRAALDALLDLDLQLGRELYSTAP